MTAWYDGCVFYHIYPLGLCGCKRENTGEAESHFEKLKAWASHAKKMNFTGIYIGPLFESVGHGYETTDYKKVDCRLGTNQDFKEFVAYCHNLGMKVIVDGVFNHVGRKFFAFQDVQEKRESSPYCSWFCNLNFGGNNEYNDGFSYENWGGYNLLVKLNQQNPEVQNYLFDVIRFWVSEFDIDGIRLDAADVLDFGFMKAMRQVANQVKPDFWLMGEVIHGDYSRWANDETLHSVTNYELHKGLYSGHNDHNYFEIAHSIKRLNDMCQGRKLYTFVDNHDVERIASKLNNKDHLSLVTILLYTVYGIPSVYYGSEFGIEGKKEQGSDWNLRPCLELSDFEDDYVNNIVTKLCLELGALKKNYPELTEGAYQELLLTNRQFAFGRVCDGSAMITALNSDDGEAVLDIPAPVSAAQAVDILGMASSVQYENGNLRVTLPANTGTVIYLGEEGEKKEKVDMGEAVGTLHQKLPSREDTEQQDKLSESKIEENQENHCENRLEIDSGINKKDGEEETGESVLSERQEVLASKEKKSAVRLQGMGLMVEDLGRMVRFYHDVLDFEINYQEGMNHIYLEKDGTVFRMYGRRDFERMTCRGYQYTGGVCGHFEIFLEVDNEAEVDRVYGRAVGMGAQSVFAPQTMEWGQRICYIADPEGNLVEIASAYQ